MLFVNKTSEANDFKLKFPLNCTYNVNCWVIGHMDMDMSAGSAKDYTCGPRAADGQLSTYFGVKDIATAGAGVDVLAAADGTVGNIINGLEDQYTQNLDPNVVSRYPCGNLVTINHEKGWLTSYCHLKKDSITVESGQKVTAGQKIGEIGLSGASDWPMLGFTVDRGGFVYDPFSGRTALEGCGLSRDTLWEPGSDMSYRPFAIYNLGFSIEPPTQHQIDKGTPRLLKVPADTPMLSFWATIFGSEQGDYVELTVTDPDGEELMYLEGTLPDSLDKRLLYVSKGRAKNVWQPGIYKGTISITRGVGSKANINQWSVIVELVR